MTSNGEHIDEEEMILTKSQEGKKWILEHLDKRRKGMLKKHEEVDWTILLVFSGLSSFSKENETSI